VSKRRYIIIKTRNRV